MKINGFSLIEVLVALLILSLGIHFSFQCLVRAHQLQVFSHQQLHLSLIAANIAESISIHGLKIDTAKWHAELNKIQKNIDLSISTKDCITHIVIQTPAPNRKIIQLEVVSG